MFLRPGHDLRFSFSPEEAVSEKHFIAVLGEAHLHSGVSSSCDMVACAQGCLLLAVPQVSRHSFLLELVLLFH